MKQSRSNSEDPPKTPQHPHSTPSINTSTNTPSKHAREIFSINRIIKWVALLLIGWLAVIYVGGYIIGYGSYNTRITLVIQTPEGLKEASVVRKVTMNAQSNLFGVSPLLTETKGEALALEVKPGQWLFGLVNGQNTPIHHSETESYTPDMSGRSMMMWYMTRWPGTGRDIITNPQTVYEPIPEDATREQERAIQQRNSQLLDEAPRSTYPGTLVTFTDINDPSTIQLVDLADLEANFGEGVRFVSGRYEYTKVPRTVGVITAGWLPWLGKVDGVFVKVPGKTEGTYTHLSVGSNGFDTEIFRKN